MSIIVGNNGGNALDGSESDDTILGQGGGDVLRGFGGDDSLNGGNGEDLLFGGAGNDSIVGGNGGDTVVHIISVDMDSFDTYSGGKGVDTLWLDFADVVFTAELVADIRRLEEVIRDEDEDETFTFDALGLTIDGFERFALLEDGLMSHISRLPSVFDDALTVTESAIDVEFSVLDNDAAEALIAVNGDPENIGTLLAGSAGGSFFVDDDGSVTFNSEGEFEALSVGESVVTEVTYAVEVPGVRGQIDIVLTQDLSGSFSNDLPNLRVQFGGLYDGLMAQGDDVGFGVASFVDKPIAPLGFASLGDYAFQTELAVSTDEEAVQNTLDNLMTRNGGDVPESQLIALQQIALRADSEIGFREDARRVVVLQTDAPFHSAGDAPWLARDDGDTDIDEREDYPTVDAVAELLLERGISVIFAVTEDVRETYEELLRDLTVNGTVLTLTSDSSNLSTLVQTGLNELVSVETATLAVTVTGENDDPSAADDTGTTRDGETVVLSVLANDSDVDAGDTLAILSVSDTAQGAVSFDAGTITYDPGSAFAALPVGDEVADSFTYTLTDGQGGTDTATVSVTVSGANLAPAASDDTARVAPDGTVLIDVLANDTDPDGDALSVISVSDGAEGTVSINSDGTLTYTAGAAFAGPQDSFTYTVTDGAGLTATADVTVSVEANLPPFFAEPVIFLVTESDPSGAQVTALDVEGDPLTFSIAGTGVDDALLEIDPDTGVLSFVTPPDASAPADAGANNQYDVDVTVTDGFSSTTQAVQIIVERESQNTPPIVLEVIALGSVVSLGQLLGGENRNGFLTTTASSGALAQVLASDPDAGDSFVFRLFGEDAPLFDLDPETGVLSLSDPLVDPRGSFDGDAIYELDVVVEDVSGATAFSEVDFLLITAA